MMQMPSKAKALFLLDGDCECEFCSICHNMTLCDYDLNSNNYVCFNCIKDYSS